MREWPRPRGGGGLLSGESRNRSALFAIGRAIVLDMFLVTGGFVRGMCECCTPDWAPGSSGRATDGNLDYLASVVVVQLAFWTSSRWHTFLTIKLDCCCCVTRG